MKEEMRQDGQNVHIKRKRDRIIIIVLSIVLAVVLAAFGFRLLVFEHYKVDGISMTPTIESGSYVWVNKLRTPQRFDVVAIEAEIYNQRANDRLIANGDVPMAKTPEKLLKRIMGVAGDTLSVDAGRYLVVETSDGTTFRGIENYGNGDLGSLSYWLYGRSDFTLTISVPEGYVFVLGDFRGRDATNLVSVDSRMFGLVALSDIVGVVV